MRVNSPNWKGVKRLFEKESNRAISLQSEFKKLGVTIEIIDDEMIIHPTKEILATTLDSHNDHRIAMACAIAATKANGKVSIENAEAINKSYPSFYKDLKLLGATMHFSED